MAKTSRQNPQEDVEWRLGVQGQYLAGADKRLQALQTAVGRMQQLETELAAIRKEVEGHLSSINSWLRGRAGRARLPWSECTL